MWLGNSGRGGQPRPASAFVVPLEKAKGAPETGAPVGRDKQFAGRGQAQGETGSAGVLPESLGPPGYMAPALSLERHQIVS